MRRHGILTAAVAAGVALLATGCGGGGGSASAEAPSATVPSSVAAPIAVAPATLDGPVRAGADTPKDVAAALKGDDVIVVGFVVTDAADDQSVAAALRTVESDPASRQGTRFFVYRVGRDHFGDLADVLGVEGTPSVAVIGRDRTLVNLFTGLVDADILRQSISDAADTAAAHPSAGAPARAAQAAGALGSPAGIALAKKVRAAYADVPAVGMEGTLTQRGVAVTLNAKMGLVGGDISSFDGTLSLKGTSIEMAGTPGGLYLKTAKATCWASVPTGTAVPENLTNPAIPLDGIRFSAPRRQGHDLVLVGSQGLQSVTWVIDAATNRVKQLGADGVGTVRFTDLTAAPAATDHTPVCTDPSQALDQEDLKALAG